MKTTKIIYWISTTLIFLFQGVMPAVSSQSKEATEAIAMLGYPAYFGVMLTVFKVLGGIILIVPQVPKRLKEWAYAGYTFDFIAASVSYFVVMGVVFFAFFPLIILAILMVSYVTFHKLNK